MIIDNELVLDAAQALTASAQTDSIDLGNGELEAKAAYARMLITTAGAGTGTVTLAVQSSDDDSTWVTVSSGPATVGTALTKGLVLKTAIPPDMGRYIRASIVVSGTVTAAVGFIDVTTG